MKNAWKKIKSKSVYKNRWIEVKEDKIILPDGKQGIYGYLKLRGGVGIIPIDKDRNIYLVGQYRYPIGKYSWEIVHGACDPGESFLKTAKRELREETGLTAKKWTEFGKLHTLVGFSNDLVILYKATDLTKGIKANPPKEPIDLKKVSLSEAIKMIEKGEITESASLVAIYKLAYLKE